MQIRASRGERWWQLGPTEPSEERSSAGAAVEHGQGIPGLDVKLFESQHVHPTAVALQLEAAVEESKEVDVAETVSDYGDPYCTLFYFISVTVM